jgi:hypothetical protein
MRDHKCQAWNLSCFLFSQGVVAFALLQGQVGRVLATEYACQTRERIQSLTTGRI